MRTITRVEIHYTFADLGRCLLVSMLPVHHSFGETLRLVWRTDDDIPRIDLGRFARDYSQQRRGSHPCHHSSVQLRVSRLILTQCLPLKVAHRLKVLQSTIVGVIVLHLLLIPGTAFLIGGSGIWEQHLHPHLAQLNNSLLTVG